MVEQCGGTVEQWRGNSETVMAEQCWWNRVGGTVKQC